MCLQRLGRLDEARDHDRQLLDSRRQDAEARALLGRIDKDAWVAAWRRDGATPAQMADGAGDADVLLTAAINGDRTGFRADANHDDPGLNAATRMSLFQHLTGQRKPPPGQGLAYAAELPACWAARAGRRALDCLALTQGAAGDDLLFAEATLALGMKLQLLRPFDAPDFLRESVAPCGADWQQHDDAVVARLDPARPIPGAPQVLSPPPAGVDPDARCNLWLLNTALAGGIDRGRMVALWNGQKGEKGEKGDGPRGTEHMVEEVRRRTGRAVVIDSHSLV